MWLINSPDELYKEFAQLAIFIVPDEQRCERIKIGDIKNGIELTAWCGKSMTAVEGERSGILRT